ncbi:MAG TPA: FxLYD domain-containing protein [Cyclobacteriaceae bacterium]
MEQSQQGKKAKLGLIGWLLFIGGMVLMFMGLGTFFLYGPIFLTTFIIAIILMTRKQVGSGIALLLMTLIIPPVFWFGILAYKVGDTINTIEQEQQAEAQDKLQNIQFEDVRIFHEGNFMYCEGKVRNTGTKKFDYVKVKVEWLDKGGTILDTDFTYAVGGEGLAPNEAKSFSIMTPSDSRMQSGRYYVFE